MAQHTWTLIDVEAGVYHDEFSLTPDDLPSLPGAWWVKKRTLRGGLQDGVDVVEVYNGRLGMTLLPTRGMGLWRCWMGTRSLGWRSPVRGPVHPKFVPLTEPSGLGWLEGFDELLVRCGLESNGAPEFDSAGNLKYPLHGRIANRPAHRVELVVDDETGEFAVVGAVEESRYLFHRLRLTARFATRLGTSVVSVHDEVENCAGTPGEMQLLYHINIGQPVHNLGSQLVAPVKECVPRSDVAARDVKHWNVYGPAEAGFAEQVYLMHLLADEQNNTQVLLKNADGSEGVGLAFNVAQLPCFAQWKNNVAEVDGYVTGIEPATNFPNPRSFEGEQGRVVQLPPGGKQAFDLELSWLPDATDVSAAEQAIAALQTQAEPIFHDRPQAGWCAGV